MKTIDSRKILALGAILAMTAAAGCFDSGPGYYNYPNGYNSSPSYSESYERSNSYDSGYRDGVRTAQSRDVHRDQDHDDDRHVAVVRDHDSQAEPEKHSSNNDNGDHYKKNSQWAPPSQKD